MPTYGKNSLEKLTTLHPNLKLICNTVINIYDNTIIYGYRNEKQQKEAYDRHESTVLYPNSKHNLFPSHAIDLAPYGVWGEGRPKIVWPEKYILDASGKKIANPTYTMDLVVWYNFGGVVLGVACALNIPLRWGGDWNRNNQLTDQNFFDLGHFELFGI